MDTLLSHEAFQYAMHKSFRRLEFFSPLFIGRYDAWSLYWHLLEWMQHYTNITRILFSLVCLSYDYLTKNPQTWHTFMVLVVDMLLGVYTGTHWCGCSITQIFLWQVCLSHNKKKSTIWYTFLMVDKKGHIQKNANLESVWFWTQSYDFVVVVSSADMVRCHLYWHLLVWMQHFTNIY